MVGTRRAMSGGKRQAASGKRQAACSKLQAAANSTRQTASGKQQAASSKQQQAGPGTLWSEWYLRLWTRHCVALLQKRRCGAASKGGLSLTHLERLSKLLNEGRQAVRGG